MYVIISYLPVLNIQLPFTILNFSGKCLYRICRTLRMIEVTLHLSNDKSGRCYCLILGSIQYIIFHLQSYQINQHSVHKNVSKVIKIKISTIAKFELPCCWYVLHYFYYLPWFCHEWQFSTSVGSFCNVWQKLDANVYLCVCQG